MSLTRALLTSGVEPYTLSALRALLAAAVILAILGSNGRLRPRSRRVLGIGLTLSVLNFAVPMVVFTLALQYAGAGFVGLLTALFPLGNAVLAHFMLADEPLTALKALGLVAALIGVAVLLASGDTGLSEGGNPAAATALSLAAVASLSFSNVFGRRHSGQYEPLQMTGLQIGFGSLWITAAMLLLEGVPSGIGLDEVALIGYLAVASTAAAFFLQFWLLRHSSATTTALVGYLVPLVAVALGLLLLDEQLQPGLMAGGILIIGGVVLTEQARSRAVSARQASS